MVDRSTEIEYRWSALHDHSCLFYLNSSFGAFLFIYLEIQGLKYLCFVLREGYHPHLSVWICPFDPFNVPSLGKTDE